MHLLKWLAGGAVTLLHRLSGKPEYVSVKKGQFPAVELIPRHRVDLNTDQAAIDRPSTA